MNLFPLLIALLTDPSRQVRYCQKQYTYWVQIFKDAQDTLFKDRNLNINMTVRKKITSIYRTDGFPNI